MASLIKEIEDDPENNFSKKIVSCKYIPSAK